MRSIELKQNVALTKFEHEKLEQTNPSGDFPFEIPFWILGSTFRFVLLFVYSYFTR